MLTPDALETQHTLATATARYDELRLREAVADLDDAGTPPPTRDEALELLALGEVIARKAGYGRQTSVRAARAAGATWTQIGAATGSSKQAAWEAHQRWIAEQAARHGATGQLGFDPGTAAAARDLAGDPD